MTRSAVMAFSPEPLSCAAARHFVIDKLSAEGVDSQLCDNAALIISELVTNAILHAECGPTVSVRIDDSVIMLEVEDAASRRLTRREYGATATTGRGLDVVAATANKWGIVTTTNGKIVWASIARNKSKADVVTPPVGGVNSVLASRSNEETFADLRDDATQHNINFVDIPVDLYLQLEAHNESLVREFTLLSLEHDEPKEQSTVVDAAMTKAIELSTSFDVRFLPLRAAALDAMSTGRHTFSTTVPLTDVVMQQVRRYATWTQLTDDLTDKGLLLVPALTPALRELRTWITVQAIDQFDGAGATPWRSPV